VRDRVVPWDPELLGLVVIPMGKGGVLVYTSRGRLPPESNSWRSSSRVAVGEGHRERRTCRHWSRQRTRRADRLIGRQIDRDHRRPADGVGDHPEWNGRLVLPLQIGVPERGGVGGEEPLVGPWREKGLSWEPGDEHAVESIGWCGQIQPVDTCARRRRNVLRGSGRGELDCGLGDLGRGLGELSQFGLGELSQFGFGELGDRRGLCERQWGVR